ncbi:GNAT family N-acetyltransferase [Leuconostoc gelidum]|uniref:GNAT family N-acetyltransferase n=1 Tax=Leuconostoc gelidum TaxID=1244 RepID=UPI001C7DDED5|nr:GNAT family N-acetyltransferase [Leuconostoc gelidum]MBZ6009929.1 GNAT family N-acetyltransferase [Leuconostoc gelidum subsp. aenigmaticum]
MTKQKIALRNNNLILRAMQSEDSDALARIYLDTRVTNFPWVKSPKLSDFDLAILGEIITVAVIDREVVGFSSLSEWDSFLHLLFIKEGWQRQGIGAVLLKKAREMVKEPLELKVVTANISAQRFYEREEFKVVAHSILSNPMNVTYRDDRSS